MKYLVELFEWGVEGEFKQLFFISDIEVERVFDKLIEEKYIFKRPYVYDFTDKIFYLDGINLVAQKLEKLGFEEIDVDLYDSYIEHLLKYIRLSSLTDHVELELVRQTSSICDKGIIPKSSIKIELKEKGEQNGRR